MIFQLLNSYVDKNTFRHQSAKTQNGTKGRYKSFGEIW